MDARERAHENFWRAFDKVDASRPLDVPALFSRGRDRLPHELQDCKTLGQLREVCSEARLHPGSGWLFGQSAIETYVDGLPPDLRLGRSQLYNVGFYEEDFLVRIGSRGARVIITHQDSAHAYLKIHREQTGGKRGPRPVTDCSSGSIHRQP